MTTRRTVRDTNIVPFPICNPHGRAAERPREYVEATAQCLEREEGREKIHREAIAAWADYQATGQHVTGAEADAWLARLEAGDDAEPPQPRTTLAIRDLHVDFPPRTR